MKFLKGFAPVAAVAAVVMLSSCQDVTEATEEELADKGITRVQASIYNAYGKGVSGLDVAEGTLISGHIVGETEAGVAPYEDYVWGDIAYTSADSAIIDFKTVNSEGRASTLTPVLKSLSGSKYAIVSSADYDDVTKSLRTFSKKLKAIADTASSDMITYSATNPEASYFVAKLGDNGDRGYALARVVDFDATYNETTVVGTNNQQGKVDIEYYYMSNSEVEEYSN